jgi:hypothetical protein
LLNNIRDITNRIAPKFVCYDLTLFWYLYNLSRYVPGGQVVAAEGYYVAPPAPLSMPVQHLEGHPQQFEGHPEQSEGHPQQLEGQLQQLEGQPQQLEGHPQQSEGLPQWEGQPQQLKVGLNVHRLWFLCSFFILLK